MKRITLLLFFLFSGLVNFAQSPINIGIKFGTNTSAMLTNIEDVLNQNISEEELNSYFAGTFVRLNLGRVYLQPEAYFNTKGGSISFLSNTLIPTTFEYKTIDVPVLAGIKFVNKKLFNFRLHGGPVFSFITNKENFVSTISDLKAEDLNENYIGWQIGAGIDLWFFTIDARIENSTNVLTESSAYEAKNRMYLLSAGIKLF